MRFETFHHEMYYYCLYSMKFKVFKLIVCYLYYEFIYKLIYSNNKLYSFIIYAMF